MARDFASSSKNAKFYPTNSISSEIDLRQEFQDWIRGTVGHPAKGQPIIFRQMRRKTGISFPVREVDLQTAPGTNSSFNENDPSYNNDWSKGERFLFDDSFIFGYRWQNFYRIIETEEILKFTQLPTNKDMFFIEYFHKPSRFDKIIEPIVDNDGKVESPIKIWRKFDIQEAEPFKGDNGRIEFWRLTVELEPAYRSHF